MSLFQPKSPAIKEYRPPFGYWDQQLYAAFFSYQPRELELLHGRSFSCTLSNRETDLQPGHLPQERYCGQEAWPLNESEHCVIAFQLEIQDSKHWLTRHIGGCTLGYMAFSWRSINGKNHPAITIAVKDEVQRSTSLSSHLSQLFAETKAAGGKGVDVRWSAVLTPMLGSSAAQVWGDWDKDSPRDSEGVLVPGKFIGLQAFDLESIEFRAVT